MNRPQPRFWLPTWVSLVAVVSVVLVLFGAARLGAVQDVGLCSGDTVLVFTDARLLNADGQNIGGPYALELPAGTYTVTAASYDGHDGTQPTQPQEQWRVAANSGWLSPFTADIADVAQTSITLFSNQIIPADVSSIELIHLGEGGVNSVSPVCIGFTRVDTGGESGSDTDDSGDDSTDVDVEDSSGGSDVDGGQTPGSDEPGESATGGSDDGGETDTGDPDSDDADNPPDSVDPDESGDPVDSDADTGTDTTTDPTDTSSDSTDNNSTDTDSSSDTTTNTPTNGTAAPKDNAGGDNDAVDDTAGDETIEPEVAGIVQEADTLAATGAGPFTGRVLGLGMVLLGIGGLVVVLTERRSYLSG